MKSKNILFFIIFLIENIKFSFLIEKFKLSVIIPVYNTELYLKKCLESIINQTYKNLEIICINDGSNDKSLEILKEFKKKDKRIIIFEQNNKGVSSARNKGIELSTGEYITFIDSDDYLNINAYNNSMDNIINNDIDILCFNMKNKRKKKIISFKIYVNDSINAMKDKRINPAIWNKIFKKQLINDNNIRFKEELYYGEDALFKLMSFVVAKKILLLPKDFYFYRKRKKSSSSKMNIEKKLNNNIQRFKYLIQFFNKNAIYNKNDYLIGYALEITYKFVKKMKNSFKKKKYAKKIITTLEKNIKKNEQNISYKNKVCLDRLKKIIRIKNDL